MNRWSVPALNLQILAAGVFFLAAVVVSRLVVGINSGKWKAHSGFVLYLRVLLGFLLAGAIALSYYAFAGIDVISGRWRP
jgi:hypothetical protein